MTFARAARAEHRRAVGGHHICRRGAARWPGASEAQRAASAAPWGRGLAPDPAVEFRLWGLPSRGISA
eukprot:2400846-Pyramimonas_sp.AAC.1